MDIWPTARPILTGGRFLGEVTLRREGGLLVIEGVRAAARVHRLRELLGGAPLLLGAAVLVVAAAQRSAGLGRTGASFVAIGALAYLVGYPVLRLTGRVASVSFPQWAVHGLEIRRAPMLTAGAGGAGEPHRVCFNVVDDRLRPTPYELRVADDEQLVEFARLLASENPAE